MELKGGELKIKITADRYVINSQIAKNWNKKQLCLRMKEQKTAQALSQRTVWQKNKLSKVLAQSVKHSMQYS